MFSGLNCVMGSGELTFIGQQHRVTFSRSTSAHADIPNSSAGSGLRGTPPLPPQTALMSHPPSGLTRRPPTAPALSVNTQAPDAERPRSSKSAMEEGNGDDAPEICLSPSWSDFGGSKKRKEKKRLGREKKEQEKKQKSETEESRAGDSWAAKRLNKKPPAAMDTQKMPSALRRNSVVSFLSSYSSSPEDSRRSSREEPRPSRLLPLGSRAKRRSQSTPNSSAELPSDPRRTDSNIVSAAPPQLPKLRGVGWHSRPSSVDSKRTSAGSGDAYQRDLVRFAESMELSSSPETPGNFIGSYSENHPLHPNGLPLGPPSFSRSRTAPDLAGAEAGRTAGTDLQRPPLAQRDSQNGNFLDRLSNGQGRRQRSITAGKENDDEMRMQPTGKFMSDEFLQISRLHGSSSGLGIQPSQLKAHRDGSSYVHKQRMHQQQLSIAGYQDELAVRDANAKAMDATDQAGEGPSVASPRSASSESSKQRTPQTSIDSEGRTEDGQEQPDSDHAFTTATPNSVPQSPTQAPQGSRADKILSFRPFQKKAKPAKPSATTKPILPVAVPSSGSPQTLPSSPTPRADPTPHQSAEKQTHGEPK